MIRARLADVPALAWVLGAALTREPLGRRWGAVVAAVAWPLWVVILATLVTARVGLWHRNRVVMALVTAPSTRSRPPIAAAVVPAMVGLVVGTAAQFAPGLAIAVAVSAAAALGSAFAPVPGRLRAGPAAPGPAIHVQMVAAATGARSALIDVARLVRDQHEPPGVPVEVVARDQSRARVFARWGLHPVTSGFGRMRSTTP